MTHTPVHRSPGQRLKPLYRGLSHKVAFFIAVGVAPLLVLAAPGARPGMVVGVYALSIIGLFGVSAAYHRAPWGPAAERLMRRLDHSMIFLTIAGTYTPIAFFTLPSHTARTVLLIVWGGAFAGIAVRVLWHDAPSFAVAGPYVVVGWVGAFVTGDLLVGLGSAGFTLLIVGGALFTIGALVYAARWPDPRPQTFGYHEVFHLFVIAGVAVHYVTVAFFALPRA